MIKGLAKHGIAATAMRNGTYESTKAPVVVCWGWRNGQRFRGQGHEVLVMERGYLGDRFAWTSLGWNGLNGHAQFEIDDVDGSRWLRHYSLVVQPWRTDGEYVLVMGQVPADMSVQRIDFKAWARSTMARLRELTDLPVLFRPHPSRVDTMGLRPQLLGDLGDALAKAAVVVTYNSNSGVDSVLAGVPTIALDAGSMAWPVAAHEFTMSPPTLPREPWLHRLAWCQWTLDEIASGEAWETIGRNVEARIERVKEMA